MVQMSPNEANKPRLCMYCTQKNSLQTLFAIVSSFLSVVSIWNTTLFTYKLQPHTSMYCICIVLYCIDLFFSLSLLLLLLLLLILVNFLFLFCTIRIVCGNFFAAFNNIIIFCPKQNWLLFCHNDNPLTTISIGMCSFVICIPHS